MSVSINCGNKIEFSFGANYVGICSVSHSHLTKHTIARVTQALTCLGIALHTTPNIAHLQGVRKYTRPGCRGLL